MEIEKVFKDYTDLIEQGLTIEAACNDLGIEIKAMESFYETTLRTSMQDHADQIRQQGFKSSRTDDYKRPYKFTL